MNRAELKTGMVIEFKNKSKGIVLLGTNDGDIVSGGTEYDIWFPLDEYDNDLSKWDNNREVEKIRQPTSNMGYLRFRDELVIWERKEETILTLDGIEYSESTLRSIIKKATN